MDFPAKSTFAVMGAPDFQFRRFAVRQDRCGMKVGTDSVLLGAGANPIAPPTSILDIGAGTGVVALMLAQRFPEASITAIEIDADAAAQAAENVAAGPFAHQITVVEGDIRQWFPERRFDWIVTNPPFHLEDVLSTEDQRLQARQALQLPPDLLAANVERLLTPDGTFSLIAPEAYVARMAAGMVSRGLWRWRQVDVYPSATKPLLRQLVDFSACSQGLTISDLVIHDVDGHYSPAYKALTADFYLAGV